MADATAPWREHNALHARATTLLILPKGSAYLAQPSAGDANSIGVGCHRHQAQRQIEGLALQFGLQLGLLGMRGPGCPPPQVDQPPSSMNAPGCFTGMVTAWDSNDLDFHHYHIWWCAERSRQRAQQVSSSRLTGAQQHLWWVGERQLFPDQHCAGSEHLLEWVRWRINQQLRVVAQHEAFEHPYQGGSLVSFVCSWRCVRVGTAVVTTAPSVTGSSGCALSVSATHAPPGAVRT